MGEVNIMELAGSHLPPYIKFDLAMGRYAQPYYLATEILNQLISLELIRTEDAERIMDGPYWFYVKMMFSDRINGLVEKNPDVVIGALTHLFQVKIKDQGDVDEVLKCDKINRIRYDRKQWKATCAECKDKESCILGEEITEMAKDVVWDAEYNFGDVKIVTGWVEQLDERISNALTEYEETLDYPLIDYDEWKSAQYKNPLEELEEMLMDDIDMFALKIGQVFKQSHEEVIKKKTATINITSEVMQGMIKW